MAGRAAGERWLLALVLAAYWWMATSVSPRVGATADEPMHLAGGYSYWKFNDYRVQPENGTLAMRWAAIPAIWSGAAYPGPEQPGWREGRTNRIAHAFFFEVGNSWTNLLRDGRRMVAVAGALTLWLVFAWARSLWGRGGAWLATGLALFSPTLLAHGGLITSDMMLTACLLAALTTVWRLLHRLTWSRLLLATLACGATFLAKMSGVLLLPMLALLLVARWLRRAHLPIAIGPVRRARTRAGVAGATLAALLVVGAGSYGLLWAGYGFRFSAFAPGNPGQFYFSWDVILDRAPMSGARPPGNDVLVPPPPPAPTPTTVTRTIEWAREHRLLPEAFLWGFAHTYKFSRSRPAYFLGENGTEGWKLFFPTAFLLKTTIPTLLLFASGVALLCASWRDRGTRGPRWWYRSVPLLALFVIYWAVALQTRLNIGQRHLLPIYPVVFVAAGATALAFRRTRSKWLAPALILAVAAHAADSWAARPFYVSYFQPLAGGPAAGHRHLVDSSFDWGQGLPDLERWLQAKERRGDRTTVFLTYFGADSPRTRKLPVTRLADEATDFGERTYPAQLTGGWYVIGATYFRGVYQVLPGPWTTAREALYGRLRERLSQAMAAQQSGGAVNSAQLLRDAMDWETMQFARLRHHLRSRRPDEVVGGSLLVFRLTDAEVEAALHGPFEAGKG